MFSALQGILGITNVKVKGNMQGWCRFVGVALNTVENRTQLPLL